MASNLSKEKRLDVYISCLMYYLNVPTTGFGMCTLVCRYVRLDYNVNNASCRFDFPELYAQHKHRTCSHYNAFWFTRHNWDGNKYRVEALLNAIELLNC